MQGKDFSGQDLRGRSFKNQDLTGADFSDCDVRGVDFSGANLTEVKFCNARMGRTKKASFILSLIQLLLSVLAGFIATTGNGFISIIIKAILMKATINSNEDIIVFMLVVINTFLFTAITVITLNRQSLNYLLCFLLFNMAISIAFAGLGAGIGIGFGYLTIIIAIIIAGVLVKYEAVTMVLAGIMIVTINIATAFSIANLMAETKIGTEFGIGIGTASGFVYVILGIYLGQRAIKKEESKLILLRNWSLKIACWYGTKFALANLSDVNFSNSDLKYASFKKAKITNCNYQQVKNHHLALTDNTPLEPRKVRNLLIDGKITDKNFLQLDLRGLVFSGLNLENFDFSHANLCGADLSHTQMTGATLESWNINTETNLNDIDCKYYYYLEDGEKKRMPPEGEDYKQGEFSRIFQKIANTIDFIAHNETELAAIKLSVEQVKVESGNDDIRIQAIEEKDGIIIVKVNAPKTEDRGVLYHKVSSLKQDYEIKIQNLNANHQGQIEVYDKQLDNMKKELDKKRNNFTVNIQNSIINNDGIFNAGEIDGDVSQHNL